jgi:hypothetical protein
MSIIGIIVLLLIVGFLFWIVSTVPIPVHPWVKTVILGLISLFLLIWVLNLLGLNTGINVHL